MASSHVDAPNPNPAAAIAEGKKALKDFTAAVAWTTSNGNAINQSGTATGQQGAERSQLLNQAGGAAIVVIADTSDAGAAPDAAGSETQPRSSLLTPAVGGYGLKVAVGARPG